jgi:hypothetical protein
MKIINEGGTVQAIAEGSGFLFFVEFELIDDVDICRLDVTEDQAKIIAKAMSEAWEAAMEFAAN